MPFLCLPPYAVPSPTRFGAVPQAASLSNAAAAASDPPAGGTQRSLAPRPQAQPHDVQREEQLPRRDGHSNGPRRTGADPAPTTGPAMHAPIAGGGMATEFFTGQARVSAAAAEQSAMPPAATVQVPQQPVHGLSKLREAGGGGGGGGGGPSGAYARLARAHHPGYPFQLWPEGGKQGAPTGAGGVHDKQAGYGSGDRVPLRERGVAAPEQLAGTGVAAGNGQRLVPVKAEVAEAAAATGLLRRAPPNAMPARSGAGADMHRASPSALRGAGATVVQEPSWASLPLGPREARWGGTQPAGGGVVPLLGNSSYGLPNQGVWGATRAWDEPPAAGRPSGPEAADVGSGGKPLAAAGAAAHALPGVVMGLAGAAGTTGNLSGKGADKATSAGGQAPELGGPEGAVAGPVGSPQGQAVRVQYTSRSVYVPLRDAELLWPGIEDELALDADQKITLYAWGNTSAPDQQRIVGQQGQELLGHPVKLNRHVSSGLRITGLAKVAKGAGVSDGALAVLRRLACGRVVLEPWQRRQGEEQEGGSRGLPETGGPGTMARVARAPCSPGSGDLEDRGPEPCAVSARQGSVKWRCSLGEQLVCQPPAGGRGIAGGSAGANGGLSRRGVQGGTRDGGEAPGSGSGQPAGASGGEAVRALYIKSAVEIGRASASALWPSMTRRRGLLVGGPQKVMVYTRCGRAHVHLGEEQEQLCAHSVKLVRHGRSRRRLTGVTVAVRELGVGEAEPVGLRRLPCGGLLMERWRQEEQGQGQQRRRQNRQETEASGKGMGTEGKEQGHGQEQQRRRLRRQEEETSGDGLNTQSSGGEEGDEEEEEQERQRTKQLKRPQQVSALDAPRSVAHGDEDLSSEGDSGTDDPEYGGTLLKRRRLLGPAIGSSGTQMALCSQQGQEGAQASARGQDRGAGAGGGPASAPVHGAGVQPCHSAGRGPVGAAAPGADVQPCHEVRFRRSSLYPFAAAARDMWPQLAEDVKRSARSSGDAQRDASAPAVLHTRTAAKALSAAAAAAAAAGVAGTQQAGGGQLAAEPHTVQLNYSITGKRWYVTRAGGVLAALGLRGEGVLQLRRAPDGRVWAEHAPTSAVAPAQQQPVPGLAAAPTDPASVAPTTDTHGIDDGRPAAFTLAHSPCASPAPSPDAPHPLAAGPSTTNTSTSNAIVCVRSGCLHPARPTVAALWPECVDMPVYTQQLVRMRAVVEPGGTAEAAAAGNAGPRHAVTHYGSQLARLGPAAWRLVCTQSLLRELRLGEGDWVRLVPLEGGVVGVRREGPEAEAARHRRMSGDGQR